MKTVYSILILITYLLSKLKQASSYDPLLIFTNSEIEAVKLPYKAEESNEQIIYPEIGQEGISHLYLCHPDSQDVENFLARHLQLYPNSNYCLINYTRIMKLGGILACESEVKPVFTDRLNKKLITTSKKCGTSVNHTLHYFGFNYCRNTIPPHDIITPVESQLLSIYEICFDTQKSRPFWTKHQVRTGFMLQGAGLQSQNFENKLVLSTEAYTSKFTLRSEDAFEKQAKEYKDQGPNPLHRMIPQMLVPHEDIAIKVWKQTTTHYLNTAPLWEKLVPVMKSINDGIRRAAITVNLKSYNEKTITDDNLDIYTTTYSHLPPFKQFLNKLNIFRREAFGWNIWCKFVHYSSQNQGIMIFLHNLPDNPPVNINSETDYSQEEQSTKQTGTYDDSNKPAQSFKGKEKDDSKAEKLLKEKECETTVPCDFGKWFSNQPEQDFLSDLFNYAYCCEVNKTKVEELFGIKLENEIALLSIDDIIADKIAS